MKQYITETELLKNLKASESFTNFYNDARIKLNNINLYIDTDIECPAKIFCLFYNKQLCFEIHIKNVNDPNNEYFLAHELTHALIDIEQYYPHIIVNENYAENQTLNYIQPTIDSVVHDPLVIARLLKYFKMEEFYVTESLQIDSINVLTTEITPLLSLVLSCLYIQQYLINEVLASAFPAKKSFTNLLDVINKKYPYVKKDIDDLLDFIKKVGYETSDGIIEIFQFFIMKYSLFNKLEVFAFTN